MLLLHRTCRTEHVVAGLHAALRAGALTADAVALEARKAADTDVPTTPTIAADTSVDPADARSGPSTQRRLSHLPPDTRPLPSSTSYDQLLRRPPPKDRPP